MNSPTRGPKTSRVRAFKAMLPASVKTLGLGGALLFPVMLIYQFGLEAAGKLQFYMAIATMMGALSRLGWDHVLFRSGAVDAPVVQKLYLRVSMLLTIAFGAFFTGIFIIAVRLLAPESDWHRAWLCGLAIVPSALAWIISEFEKGRGNAFAWSIFNNTGAHVLNAVGMAIVLVLNTQSSTWAALLYFVSNLMIAMAACLRLSMFAYFPKDNLAVSVKHDRQVTVGSIVRESLGLAPLSFSSSAQNWLDVTVVGLLQPPEIVALIRLAGRLSFLPPYIFGLTVASVSSSLARAIHAGQSDEALRHWRKTAILPVWLGALATATLLIFLITFGRRMELGTDYQLPTLVLILSIGHLVAAATGAVGYVLLACNKDRILRRATVIGLFFAALVQIVGTKVGGATGSAIASAFYIASYNVVLFACALSAFREVMSPPSREISYD